MKEGDIYMNGQYHNPNDFWRQRMEPWEYDSIGKDFRKLVKAIAVLAIVALLMWLLCGCRTWKHNTTEREQTDDSVRIEYREKIIRVPVTVYVEVPVERQIQMADDSSHLETSFAVSDARMIWIDSVPFLRHSLENKPQKIARTDSVPVVEKEKIMWKTRRVTYTKTEIREKKPPWWQKGLMWAGGVSIVVCLIFLIAKLMIRIHGGGLATPK